MKIKREFLVLFTAVVTVIILVCGCGDNSKRMDQSENMQLLLTSRADLSDADVALLPADFQEKAATIGWNRVLGGFEQTTPGLGVMVTDGQTTIITDKNGYFRLPRSASTDHLRVVFGKTQLPLKRITSRSTETIGFGLTLPYTGCCTTDSYDTISEQYGNRGAMSGRCLDYNGWWSDGRNYPLTDWRAYRNFVASDCNRAWAVFPTCFGDRFLSGCWAVHGDGGCSRTIHHSWRYHKHNFPW